MRWLALLLLAANLAYLGWELDRGTRALVANSPPPLKIPAGAETLKIMDETAGLQELKPVYGWQQPRRVLLPSGARETL
ncbi:MAG: hypothetical protein OXI88_05850 [Gammaproteobacteria bacterium]|nr:hypothetical protein [Gammaproteobacteria bacterium]